MLKESGTKIEGVKYLELDSRFDDRGAFVEALPFSAYPVRQVNLARNEKAGTVRGMHWQSSPAAQVKIVYAVAGKFLDVAVDIRRESPTYGQVVTVELFPFINALYIPAGIAHGCQALEDGATLMYLLDVGYAPEHERGFRVDDPSVRGIWTMPLVNVARRDMNWPWMGDLP